MEALTTLLKQYFWTVKAAGLALAVGFGASALMQLAGATLVLDPENVATLKPTKPDPEDEEDDAKKPIRRIGPEAPAGASLASRKNKVASNLVKQNPFCPTCMPAEPEPTEDGAAPTGPVRPGEVRSSLPLALLATMEAEDPKFSMAVVQDTQLNVTGTFGVGDELRKGVPLEKVERGKIVFRNGRQMEFVQIGGEPPPPPKVKPKVPNKSAPRPTTGTNSRAIPGAEEAIKCSGDTCTIDRKFVEKILANPAMLAKQARVVPAVRNGSTRGFKFYGIRPGTLPKLLGLNNGDMITAVNGTELTSIDQAMALYTKLRRASNLSITLERRGKAITKDITIK